MTTRKPHFAALLLLAMTPIPSATSSTLTINKGALDLPATLPLAGDYPAGHGAIVTPISFERSTNLQDATISTFIVDCPPGVAATLHRAPSSGYVLVHVLTGTIRAFAWHAWIGIYRAGQTWAEPAFANDITAVNASTRESARMLVILVTGAQDEKMGTVAK